MQTTGLFTIHEYTISFRHYGEPIYLIPFGDIHRSSPQCAVEHWEDFLAWAKKKERVHFLGMGDYDDLISTSERKVLADDALHESTRKTLESMYAGMTKRLAKEIGFMRGKIVGLLEGNHYATFADGSTSTQMLCRELDARYLGVCTMIRLHLLNQARKSCGLSLDIFAHHGRGASRLIGGSLNRVQQMAESVEADIHLMGHDHRKSVGMSDRLCLVVGKGLRLHNRKVVFARTGSFLKGYEPDCPSYVVDAQLSPTNMGVIKIEITPKRITNGGRDYAYADIHASI